MGCWLIQNVSPIHLKSPNAWSWKEDVGLSQWNEIMLRADGCPWAVRIIPTVFFWYPDSPHQGNTLGAGLDWVTLAWLPQLMNILVILAAGTQNTSPLKCSCYGRQWEIHVQAHVSRGRIPCCSPEFWSVWSAYPDSRGNSPVPTSSFFAWTALPSHPFHSLTNESKRQNTRSHFLARVWGV